MTYYSMLKLKRWRLLKKLERAELQDDIALTLHQIIDINNALLHIECAREERRKGRGK